MDVLYIEDMNNTFIEHSFIINNFVVMVGKQIKDSLCRVLGDVSINYNTHGRKNVSF